MSTSKLSLIRAALATRTDLTVIGEKTRNPDLKWFFGPTPDGFTQWFEIFVAMNSDVFDPDVLQGVMNSMLPDISPTVKHFRLQGEELYLGRLEFDEVIGTETVEQKIAITDSDTIASLNGTHLIVSGGGSTTRARVSDVKRKVVVRLYPNRAHAESHFKDVINPGPLVMTDVIRLRHGSKNKGIIDRILRR